MEEVALESSRGGWEGSDAWSAHLPIMVLKCAYRLVGFFIRPFGWMNNGGDGGEGCFEQRRHSPGTKVPAFSEGQELTAVAGAHEHRPPPGSTGIEGCHRHGLKGTQEGFQFAGKGVLFKMRAEGWAESVRTEQTAL